MGEGCKCVCERVDTTVALASFQIRSVLYTVVCIHLRFSLGFWPIPGVGETEVGHTEVVLAAVLLDADRVPGDKADVLWEAAEALELGGGGGEAEDGAEVGPAGRQLHREPRLQAGQLVPDVGLKRVGFRHSIIYFFLV